MSSGPAQSRSSVLGVDIGGTKIDVALATTAGRILDRVQVATDAEAGPSQALDRLGKLVNQLRRRSDTEFDLTVAAIGAVGPGVIHDEEILLAPNLPGWERVALSREIAAMAGLETATVLNDVKAAALAEARYGALGGADPGLYVNLGTGLAAAVVIAGQVVDGAHGAAGEIGYVISGASLGAKDPQTELESRVGGKGLGDRWGAVLGRPATAADLMAADGPEAQAVLDQGISALATALVNVCALIDPERIVLGGGLMAAGDRILPPLADYLQRLVPFPPEIRPASFVQDASLYGAIALAVDSVSSRPAAATGVSGGQA